MPSVKSTSFTGKKKLTNIQTERTAVKYSSLIEIQQKNQDVFIMWNNETMKVENKREFKPGVYLWYNREILKGKPIT